MVVQNQNFLYPQNPTRREFGLALFATLTIPKLTHESLEEQNAYKTPEEEFSKACRNIIGLLEETLKISFLTSDIKVVFEIPKYYIKNSESFIAKFNIESHEIVFHPRYRQVNVSPLIENPKAKMYPEDLDGNAHASDQDLNLLREIIAHELGHYFMATLIDKKFPDSWITTRYRDDKPIGIEDLGLVIVQEGIGECFGAVVSDKPDYFASSSWDNEWHKEDLSDPRNWQYLSYQGGFSLIKPLLDNYGQAALEYLATNPLSFNLPSLKAAKDYQLRALKELKESAQR
jgi:hypothetical protein